MQQNEEEELTASVDAPPVELETGPESDCETCEFKNCLSHSCNCNLQIFLKV